MRVRVRGWLGLFAVTGTVAIAVACSNRIPNQPEQNLCDGTQVHATRIDPNSCTVCLEDKCCDDVGDCSRNDACKKAVLKAQTNVLEEGPNAGRTATEQACLLDAGVASAPGADKMYSCMRGSCGLPCGLPVCKLEPGVPSMPTARCDDCFAQTCCRELNECSHDRRCRRMLECIITKCSDEFHTQLVPTNYAVAASRVSQTCSPGAVVVPGSAPGGPADGASGAPVCFDQCFNETIEFNVGAADASLDLDRGYSACLASNAFLCGARANCGPDCVFDAGVEAAVAPGNDAGDAGAPDAADASDAD